MEHLPERIGNDTPERIMTPRLGPERQLASGQNKVQRMTAQSKGLVDDITGWVELKIKLTQTEIENKIQAKINMVVMRMAPLVVGLIAGLFLLVTLALFLGWMLGQPAWGFLIVTLILALVALVLFKKFPQKFDEQDPRQNVQVSEEALSTEKKQEEQKNAQ